MRHAKILIAELLLCSAFAARGDTLADVKAALATLPGQQPFAATLDLTSTNQDSDDKREGRATVRVQGNGGGGLEIVYSPELLQRLQDEARLEGTDKPQPATNGIREVHVTGVAEDVNHAPVLARTLAHSHLIEQKTAVWQGQPARMLRFNVDVPISEKEKKHVKEATETMTLWLAADNTPLALQRALHAKARFMLISFEDNQTEDRTFARWGDRLVVTRKVLEENASGMGQKTHNRSVQTITRTSS